MGLFLSIPNLQAGELTNDGAWCWFQDPRAVYFSGEHERTYASWMQGDGQLMVGYLDHQDLSTHSVVIRDQWDIDDHNTGSLLLMPDRRLMMFYARHNKKGLFARISQKPESIDLWEPEITVADTPRITYSHPVYLSEEKQYYVFWRGSTCKPTYATSSDGQHWSEPRVLIQQQGKEAQDIRPYLKVGNDGKSKIHFVFTDGHPRNEPLNSVYYMEYSHGKFLKADGKVIGNFSDNRPVSHKACSVVYNAQPSGARAWVWDVAQDSEGHPVVLYTRHPNDRDHRYHWARWSGSEWQDVTLCQSGKWFPQTPEGVTEPEPHYSGGMSLNSENPYQVCGSRQINGQFELVWWSTQDRGKQWDEKMITQKSRNLNVRPVIPRGISADNVHVLFMNGHYRHYTDYHTAIHWASILPASNGR